MPPISQSLSQVARKRANQIIAPQLAQQTSYGAHQNAVIRAFANSLLGKLQPIAGQVGGDYDAAIKQIGSLSSNAASFLSGQNPAASQTALGSAVGAPAEQQAQQTQALGNTFQGGAGVLAYTGGTIPGSELAANKAAAMSQARALPAIGALAGQQSLAGAVYQQGQAREKLLAQRPGLVQQEENAIQRNNLSRAATKQRADAAQAKLNAKASEIDPSVSKLTGVLTYSDGTQAKDAKGKPIPIVAGAGTAAKPFRYQDSYGREVQLNPDGTQQALSEGTWTDSAGRTYRVGLDGKQTLVSTRPASAATVAASKPKLIGSASTGYSWLHPDGTITPVPGPKGKPAPGAQSGGLTTNSAAKMLSDWHDGTTKTVRVPAVGPDGKPVYDDQGVPRYVVKTERTEKKSYQDAVTELVGLGWTRQRAVAAANGVYKQGDAGRPFEGSRAVAEARGYIAIHTRRGESIDQIVSAMTKSGLIPPAAITAAVTAWVKNNPDMTFFGG